jgi:hypothetical protein
MTKDGCHSKQYPVQPSMTAASSVYCSGSNLGEMNTPLSMASNLRPRSGSAGDRAWPARRRMRRLWWVSDPPFGVAHDDGRVAILEMVEQGVNCRWWD